MSGINPYTPVPPIPNDDKTISGERAPPYHNDDNEDDAHYEDVDLTDLSQLNLNGKTVEDVTQELTKRIREILVLEDFSSQACAEHIYFINSLCTMASDDAMFGDKLGSKLTKLRFVELSKEMWKKHLNAELFKLNKNDLLWFSMITVRSILWNMSDKSNRFCDRIIRTNFHSDIVKYLGSEHLKPEMFQEKPRQEVIQGFIGVLHNVVQRASTAREALRKCKTVEVLQAFRECEHKMVSIRALMIQSYLVNEEENEKLNSNIETFEFLINLLDGAIQGVTRFSVTLSVVEVLKAINNLAANDMNKERIVQVGALPYYVKLLQPDRKEEEQKHAAHGLWILGFLCQEDIKKEPGCIEALKYLQENTKCEAIKKEVNGALWTIHDATHQQPSGHIFISYQWDSKSAVLRVRDCLRDAGFPIWIDEESMSGSVLEAMAEAVEKASVVVICMSQKYKDSPSCRTEAQYTYRLRKKVIPLRFQQSYKPDGWLGALIASELVFDCSQPDKLETSVKNLIRELRRPGKAGHGHGPSDDVASVDVVDGPIKKRPVTAAVNWTREDIDTWIKQSEITDLHDWSSFNGRLLVAYAKMRRDAPEYFFAGLKEKNLSLTDQLKLSEALQNVIDS